MNAFHLATQSLRTAWKNRALWFFGFFVAASGGAGAGGARSNGAGLAGDVPTWVFWLVGTAIVLGLTALVLHVISEAALIAQVKTTADGGATSLRDGFRSGWGAFGVVLRLKLVLVLAGVALATAVLGPVALGVAGVLPLFAGAGVTGLVAVLSVPFVVVGLLTFEVALRIAVLERADAMTALRRARAYLDGRLLESLQVLVVASLSQVGMALAGLFVTGPGVVLGVVVFGVTQSLPAALVAGAVVAVPLLVPVVGLFGAYRSTVWTMGFLSSRALERS